MRCNHVVREKKEKKILFGNNGTVLLRSIISAAISARDGAGSICARGEYIRRFERFEFTYLRKSIASSS